MSIRQSKIYEFRNFYQITLTAQNMQTDIKTGDKLNENLKVFGEEFDDSIILWISLGENVGTVTTLTATTTIITHFD